MSEDVSDLMTRNISKLLNVMKIATVGSLTLTNDFNYEWSPSCSAQPVSPSFTFSLLVTTICHPDPCPDKMWQKIFSRIQFLGEGLALAGDKLHSGRDGEYRFDKPYCHFSYLLFNYPKKSSLWCTPLLFILMTILSNVQFSDNFYPGEWSGGDPLPQHQHRV